MKRRGIMFAKGVLIGAALPFAFYAYTAICWPLALDYDVWTLKYSCGNVFLPSEIRLYEFLWNLVLSHSAA